MARAAGGDASLLRQISRLAVLTFLVTLLAACWWGQALLDLFGITLDAFRVPGGLILIPIGLRLIEGMELSHPDVESDAGSLGVVPIGLPLLAGSGAISLVVADSPAALQGRLALSGVITLLAVGVYAILRVGMPLRRALGELQGKVISRLMGLLLSAIGVQMLVDGLKGCIPELVGAGGTKALAADQRGSVDAHPDVPAASLWRSRYPPVLRAAMTAVLKLPLTEETLRALFTKPYGAPAPSAEQWRAVYDESVHFQDPTQEKSGIDAYIVAQEGLMRRCDDVFLEPGAVALSGETAFVEWTMGLKIKGIEFVYPGTTRLRIGADGKIVEHRDYFDFVGPTFAPVPVVGGFVRWLYRRFVS